MKTLVKAGIAAVVGFAPLLAFGQAQQGVVNNFLDLIGVLNTLINTLFPFIIGLAVLVILWGIFNYIAGAGDEEKRAQAKSYIIWGIIGLFVMVSIWGLVNILSGTFRLTNEAQNPPNYSKGAIGLCPDGSPAVENPETHIFECNG